MNTHLSRLARFRTDPDACPIGQQQLTWQMLQRCALTARFHDFQQNSLAAYHRSCTDTLRGLACGAPAKVWVSRLSWCVEVEAAIDQCCPQNSKLASSCATTWLKCSLPLLPWILAALISPREDSAEALPELESMQRLRRAAEVSEDAEALAWLQEALVKACALLCAASETVSSLTLLMLFAHEAAKVLLPEVTAGALAAALAVALAPSLKDKVPPEPPPWETVLGMSSNALHLSLPARSSTADLEDIAESIARAVHGEVIQAFFPGKPEKHFLCCCLCVLPPPSTREAPMQALKKKAWLKAGLEGSGPFCWCSGSCRMQARLFLTLTILFQHALTLGSKLHGQLCERPHCQVEVEVQRRFGLE